MLIDTLFRKPNISSNIFGNINYVPLLCYCKPAEGVESITYKMSIPVRNIFISIPIKQSMSVSKLSLNNYL